MQAVAFYCWKQRIWEYGIGCESTREETTVRPHKDHTDSKLKQEQKKNATHRWHLVTEAVEQQGQDVNDVRLKQLAQLL